MRTALLALVLAPLAGLAQAQVTVELGPEETVMAWNDGQRCGMEDIPDHPARAFVDSAGRVHLLAGHFELYESVGDHLKAVVRRCDAPVSSSHHDPDPRAYDDAEWIFGTYTLDGQTIYGLVHDEYHGLEHGNCNSAEAFNCWWNAVTLVVSGDAGATFRHAAPLLPPAHVIASSPYDYDPNNTAGAFGFFEPSNVLSAGGHYYAFLHLERHDVQGGWGTCLMRTDDLADPASWRGWDGTGFSLVLDRGLCPPMQQAQIGKMGSSLSYNTYLRRNLLVGTDGGPTDFHLAASESLTSWPRRQVLMATPLWWTAGAAQMRGYPSLLQPGDPSRNFERTARSPYLYYTYWDQAAGLYARDLRRRRVRFSLPGDEGRHQVLELPMNERRGTATLDASFYGNDAVLEGGAVLAADERATSSVRLPAGGTARIRVPDAPSLDLAGSLTIEAFLRIEAASAAPAAVVEKKAGALLNYGLYVAAPAATTPGVLTFSFSTSAGGLSASEGTRRVDDGRWHHVAVVYDGPATTARYYVDGALDVERSHGALLGAGVNGGALLIGVNVVGALDGVVVHDHVRTPQELLQAAGTRNVELCNGADDDGDGLPDNGWACVRGATVTRACETAPGGVQTSVCGQDCALPSWPSCAPLVPPPVEPPATATPPDSSAGGGCGCQTGGEAALPALLLAAALLRRSRRLSSPRPAARAARSAAAPRAPPGPGPARPPSGTASAPPRRRRPPARTGTATAASPARRARRSRSPARRAPGASGCSPTRSPRS